MSEERTVEAAPEIVESPAGEREESEPTRATPERRKKSYEIDIFRGWCKSCGICAAFCPRHCISLDEDGSPVVEASAQCSGCGWCEIHCPDFAISVRQIRSSRDLGEQD